MNLNKISLIAAVAALMLTGCNNDLVLQSEASDNAIEFSTVMDKTRASLIDKKADLSSFFVQAYHENELYLKAAAYNDGTPENQNWTYAPKKYWPADNTPVDFYAFAPISDVNMGSDGLMYDAEDDIASFDYTVPYNQKESNTAVDLLVASELGRTKDRGSVRFKFKHALSSVMFSAKNGEPDPIQSIFKSAKESDLVYTISNIEITNLYNKGTYTYDNKDVDGLHWGDYNNVVFNYYTAGIPESGVAVKPGEGWVKLLSYNDYMMVLPQVVKYNENTVDDDFMLNNTFVRVTFSLKQPDGSFIHEEETVNFWLGKFTFEEGARYDFQFSFTNGGGIDDGGDPIETNPTPIKLKVVRLASWRDIEEEINPLSKEE